MESSDRRASVSVATESSTEGLEILTVMAVRHLFGLTLEMSRLLELSGDPEVGRGVRQLIRRTDDLISEFRRVDSELRASQICAVDTVDGESHPQVPDAFPDGSQAVNLLREASSAIDRSLGFFRHQSQASGLLLEVELEEASCAVHRALIALTA